MDQNKVKSEEPKVLLTQGEDGKLKVITGEQDGKLKTVEPTKANADQFLKVDTNSNFLENFFKSSRARGGRGAKHPTFDGITNYLHERWSRGPGRTKRRPGKTPNDVTTYAARRGVG